MIGSVFNTRQSLDETINNIIRAIRYAEEDAIVRNVTTRVRFKLDEAPQEFTVEFGPDNEFVIPLNELEAITKTGASESDEEQYDEALDKISKQFNSIREFSEGAKPVANKISIIGVGTTLIDYLISDNEASIYVHPTGEKDGAIVILSSPTEVVSIEVSPFNRDIETNYMRIPPTDTGEEFYEKQIAIAKELYEKWIKGK